jgi:hypothetical protein
MAIVRLCVRGIGSFLHPWIQIKVLALYFENDVMVQLSADFGIGLS